MTSRYLALSEAALRKKGAKGEGCEKERRSTTENTQLLPETFANWFSSPLLPRDYLTVTPVGNGIRGKRGASETG